MSNLVWLVLIFLMAVLVISMLWLVWKMRHFSQSHNNQTVLDDKLMQSMLGDEALSKELKNALVGKASGVETAPAAGKAGEKQGTGSEKTKRTGRQTSK